jgi:enamidase
MLLHNLGGVYTGDASAPTAGQDAIAISDGLIAAPGPAAAPPAASAGERLDAAGGWAMPGLWDGAQNLYFGDHTPALSATGALAASVGFGVTSVVAVHPAAVPGAGPGARFQRELAVLTMKSWAVERPGGLHVHVSTVLGHPGWDADDLQDLAACGADLLLLPASMPAEDAARLAKTGRESGLRIGLWLDGEASPAAVDELLATARPELATPVNAPGLAPDVVSQLVEADDCALGLILAGDLQVAARVARRCADSDRPWRPFLGTGMPDHRGVMPAGLALFIDVLGALTGLAPGLVVAMASGNVARAFGRPGGVLAPGEPADVVVLAGPGIASPWLRRPATTLVGGYPNSDEQR